MKRAIYVDYENVSLNGLTCVEKLTKDDCVKIFIGRQSAKLSMSDADRIFNCKASVELITNQYIGKNALDFIIMVHLGYDIAKEIADEYFIISKDKGYDPAILEMKKKNGSVIKRCDDINMVVETGKKLGKAILGLLKKGKEKESTDTTEHTVLNKTDMRTADNEKQHNGDIGKRSNAGKNHRKTEVDSAKDESVKKEKSDSLKNDELEMSDKGKKKISAAHKPDLSSNKKEEKPDRKKADNRENSAVKKQNDKRGNAARINSVKSKEKNGSSAYDAKETVSVQNGGEKDTGNFADKSNGGKKNVNKDIKKLPGGGNNTNTIEYTNKSGEKNIADSENNRISGKKETDKSKNKEKSGENRNKSEEKAEISLKNESGEHAKRRKRKKNSRKQKDKNVNSAMIPEMEKSSKSAKDKRKTRDDASGNGNEIKTTDEDAGKERTGELLISNKSGNIKPEKPAQKNGSGSENLKKNSDNKKSGGKELRETENAVVTSNESVIKAEQIRQSHARAKQRRYNRHNELSAYKGSDLSGMKNDEIQASKLERYQNHKLAMVQTAGRTEVIVIKEESENPVIEEVNQQQSKDSAVSNESGMSGYESGKTVKSIHDNDNQHRENVKNKPDDFSKKNRKKYNKPVENVETVNYDSNWKNREPENRLPETINKETVEEALRRKEREEAYALLEELEVQEQSEKKAAYIRKRQTNRRKNG